MTTLTIPKSITKFGDLVLIPRKEYEKLLHVVEDDLRDPDEGMELRPEFERSLRKSIREKKEGKMEDLLTVLKRYGR